MKNLKTFEQNSKFDTMDNVYHGTALRDRIDEIISLLERVNEKTEDLNNFLAKVGGFEISINGVNDIIDFWNDIKHEQDVD